MSRFGARAALLALALLAVAGLSPLAAADHTFAHRYIIYGKVVDSRGYPVPNVTVEFRYDPAKTAFAPEFEVTTVDQPGTETAAFGPTLSKHTTNAHGEFTIAYHVHGISKGLPGTYFLGASNSTGGILFKNEYPFDPFHRIDYPVIKLDHEEPAAVPDDATFTVIGRLFIPSSTALSLDGAPGPMYGHTINNVPVSITIKQEGHAPANYTTSTNNYGDFAYRVPVDSNRTGEITIEAANTTAHASYDPKAGAGMAAMKIDVSASPDPFLRGALIVVGVVVVIAVVVGVGFVGYRRMAARREEASIRSVATRRRSR